MMAGFVERAFNLKNVNAVCFWRPHLGAALLVIESKKTDRVVEGIYRQLKDSVSSQFLSNARLCFVCN